MTFLKNGNSSEKVNLKFCKYMLRVSKKCTNIAVLTELGRFPIVYGYIKANVHVLA